MHACMHTYIHTHIHTYTYIPTYLLNVFCLPPPILSVTFFRITTNGLCTTSHIKSGHVLKCLVRSAGHDDLYHYLRCLEFGFLFDLPPAFGNTFPNYLSLQNLARLSCLCETSYNSTRCYGAQLFNSSCGFLACNSLSVTGSLSFYLRSFFRQQYLNGRGQGWQSLVQVHFLLCPLGGGRQTAQVQATMLYLKSYLLKSYLTHPLHTPLWDFSICFFVFFPYVLIKTGHQNHDKWILEAKSFVFI